MLSELQHEAGRAPLEIVDAVMLMRCGRCFRQLQDGESLHTE